MTPLLFNECENRMKITATENFSPTEYNDDCQDDFHQDEFVYEELDQSHENTLEATIMEILSSAIPSCRYHQSLILNSSDAVASLNDRHNIFLRHQSHDDIIRHRNLQLGNSYSRRSNSISNHVSQSICKTMNENHSRTVFAMAQLLCPDVYSAKLVQTSTDGCKLELTKVYLVNNTEEMKKRKNGTHGCNMKSSTTFDLNLKSNSSKGNSTLQQEVDEYYYLFETTCYEEYHVWYEMMNIHKKLNSPKVTSWILCNPLSALYLSCILSFVTQPEWSNHCHNNISTTTMLVKAIFNYLLSIMPWSSSPTQLGRSVSIYEVGIFLWIILISFSILFRLYHVVRVIQYYSRYSYVFVPSQYSNTSNNNNESTTFNQWIFSILMVGLPAITEFQELQSIHQHYVITTDKISNETDTIRWEDY